ncbi:M56 family metallopeptidase [Paenibacillus sp. MMS20-IR301]|uniref:M56 family metallopeptidase n=1 Tax=Paenibacillus sp. MMS20-IR301 TaxID=2895946 RepID=UPI0028E50A20|nr:M56 family metallopeptidase [Paenibacillus sp. MMS20-IR301]WNS46223.1 M56 family metallopeptidase [Paenibacillus sp. MMS20-IR301]
MTILDKSISAAVMIIAVAAIRSLVLYKLPRTTFVALWGIVMIHLFNPFSFTSRFSVYAGVDLLKQAVAGAGADGTAPLSPSGDHAAQAIVRLTGIETQAASVSVFQVIWLSGVLIFGVLFITLYLKCRRKFATSLPVADDAAAFWLKEYPARRSVDIRQSDKIISPLTYGIFRPVVLLPKAMDWSNEAQLRHILAHEFAHIRRFDALTKLLLAFTLAVYWFNPLVWLMVVLAGRDIELSCDEAVVKGLDAPAKTAYAMTLIGMEEKKSALTLLFNNFSKHSIEERIVSVMKMKKTTVMGMTAALALIIAVPAVFAAEAAVAPDQDAESAIVLSVTDKVTGVTSISEDDGVTWMEESEYLKTHPAADIVWWTADEYQKWLDQEKIELQSLADAPGWSQDKIDNAVRMYEENLQYIKAGGKLSRTVNGDDSIVYSDGTLAGEE